MDCAAEEQLIRVDDHLVRQDVSTLEQVIGGPGNRDGQGKQTKDDHCWNPITRGSSVNDSTRTRRIRRKSERRRLLLETVW